MTNAWLAFENSLAASMWAWYLWYLSDRDGVEPSLSEWDKRAVRKLADMKFIIARFLQASGGGKTWRLLSVYDVTKAQIDAGYARHGDASEGGDFECAGLWTWNPGDTLCVRDDTYGWQPAQVLKFMPAVCTSYDVAGDCLVYVDATELADVSLVMGQPPRDLS